MMMAVNDASPIKRLSARERDDMHLPILALKPAHITLEVHYFVSELADIRPDDENLLAGQAQSHSFPEALEPFSEGSPVAFPVANSSGFMMRPGFGHRLGMSVAFSHNEYSRRRMPRNKKRRLKQLGIITVSGSIRHGLSAKN
jgi:hypothetical protein